MNDTLRQDAISRVGITIAIDGPAGSGKSTVSKELASRLGIGYLDTGAMYRALTWYALDRGIDLEDTDAVAAAANEMVLRLQSDPADPHVWVGETEVTAAIREPRIALAIKHISTNLKVRAWMAAEQRRRMMEARQQGSGMIAEGRDITTVVCPDADVRILLLADQEARLRRRTLELYGDATEEHMEIVRAQVEGRDKADSAVSEFMASKQSTRPAWASPACARPFWPTWMRIWPLAKPERITSVRGPSVSLGPLDIVVCGLRVVYAGVVRHALIVFPSVVGGPGEGCSLAIGGRVLAVALSALLGRIVSLLAGSAPIPVAGVWHRRCATAVRLVGHCLRSGRNTAVVGRGDRAILRPSGTSVGGRRVLLQSPLCNPATPATVVYVPDAQADKDKHRNRPEDRVAASSSSVVAEAPRGRENIVRRGRGCARRDGVGLRGD